MDFSKARKEIEAGRLERAREIVASKLSGAKFSEQGTSLLGDILLQLGELSEAGRYLLFVDRKSEQVEAACQAFLKQHGASATQLVSKLPSSAIVADGEIFNTETLKRRLMEAGIDYTQFEEAVAARADNKSGVGKENKNKEENTLLAWIVRFFQLFS
ncbi:MAG: DUF6584 family protein [Pseudomonadota bacterium]